MFIKPYEKLSKMNRKISLRSQNGRVRVCVASYTDKNTFFYLYHTDPADSNLSMYKWNFSIIRYFSLSYTVEIDPLNVQEMNAFDSIRIYAAHIFFNIIRTRKRANCDKTTYFK